MHSAPTSKVLAESLILIDTPAAHATQYFQAAAQCSSMSGSAPSPSLECRSDTRGRTLGIVALHDPFGLPPEDEVFAGVGVKGEAEGDVFQNHVHVKPQQPLRTLARYRVQRLSKHKLKYEFSHCYTDIHQTRLKLSTAAWPSLQLQFSLSCVD